MHLFLCGGGSAHQTAQAYAVYAGIMDLRRPLLYLPIAMEPEEYNNCYAWVRQELHPYGITNIEMVDSPQALAQKDLYSYAGMYIGGGNTYKLLKELKTWGCFEKIRDYLYGDSIIFGSSAGCAIFGEDINSVSYADRNEVGLTDTRGFHVLHRTSFACHFTNNAYGHIETARGFLMSWTVGRRVLALPEETTLYLHDGTFDVLGTGGVYEFRDGMQR